VKRHLNARITLAIADCVCVCVYVSWPIKKELITVRSFLIGQEIQTQTQMHSPIASMVRLRAPAYTRCRKF